MINSTTTITEEDKDELFRHLAKIPENELINGYFDKRFSSLRSLKKYVTKSKWTWKEFAALPRIEPFVTPQAMCYIDKKERNECRKEFKKDIAFLFMRHHFSRAYYYPDLFDIMDFVEESMILCKDPDHSAVSGVHFLYDTYIDKDGKEIEFAQVTFSLDS